MKRFAAFSAALLVWSCFPGSAEARRRQYVPTQEEEQLWKTATQLYQNKRDKIAAIEAFERFTRNHEDSPKAADAQFMVGEGYMSQALKILKKEAESKKTDTARLLAPKNTAAIAALQQAEKAFAEVLRSYRKRKTGLLSSSQYRLGEVYYNQKEWGKAIEAWREVEEEHRKSYIVPEAWMGVIFANLALEQFSQAEANLFLLGETYPHYLKEPDVLYVQGIISLHKGDYANAERALKRVKTPEAAFYLGKTYLLSKRPYLAAAAFQNLVKTYPGSVLIEETEFFIGDSFFLAKDFDGAITKYRRFSAKYPRSPLRVSALFRIGSAYFQKGNYVEARAHFQSVIDRYPRDFFAPLAQYFIAESYLVADQFREALFAYTKVITQYPETIKISPLAHYKLAWTQYQVSDYTQAAQTCRNFLSLYPANSLAKNVYIVLANSLLASKRHDEAVTSFQRIIDLAPTSDVAEQALFSILLTQYNLKRYNAILTSYQFIFRHLPPSQSKWRPLSYLYAAEAYVRMNRVDEAKAIYEMILKVYPNDKAAFYAQDGLAWAYQLLGDDVRAHEEREKLQGMLELMKDADKSAFAENQLGIADSMYNQKKYEDAFQLYEKFCKENPEAKQAARACYQQGMSLYQLRYYTQAIEAWTHMRNAYPKAKEVQKAEYQIGDTLFRAQKYPEAVQQYQRIIDTYPSSKQLPLAYLRVAMSNFNSKNDAGTLNAALALLKRFPNAAETVDGLDLMEAVYDRSPNANFRASLRAVIEAVPGTETAAEAQFRIGRRLFEMKKYADSAEEFQRFSVDFTASSKLRKAQFLLAESLYNAEKYQEASHAFERFLNNFPINDDTPLALFHAGSALYGMKKHEPAIKYYQRLMDEYPDSEYTKAGLFNLALAYKATGNLERAEEAYARYATREGTENEGGRAALWEMFTIQKDRKDYAGAMSTLNRISDAKSDPETLMEVLYRKGELYLLMVQKDEALRVWEDLVPLSPKSFAYRLQGLIKLGEEYEERKDYPKAVRVYYDLCKHAPQPAVKQAACERAKGLKSFQAGSGPPPSAGPGDRYKTQVMPEEDSKKPRSQKKSKKKKPRRKKSSKKKPQTKKTEEINIPGMN
jgi:TolA-binding protein